MILVLGVGVVGKSVIEYFRGKAPICFYDDKIQYVPDVPRFESWDNVDLVVASPGIALKHDMMQEAIRRGIRITNDIEIFLHHKKVGIKIAITGTNGKSTTSAMIEHVLSRCEVDGRPAKVCIGGNFGVSPLEFPDADYYVIELSSYQLELMNIEDLHHFDIGIITNIYPNHLSRHGAFDDYVSIKCKIFGAKYKVLGFCDLFQDWDLESMQRSEQNEQGSYFKRAIMPKVLPDAILFERVEYKYCWGIVNQVLDILGLDKQRALEIAKDYLGLPYRQEIVKTNPITVINDSKSTNGIAAKQAISNIKDPICWIAGGAGTSEWGDLSLFSQIIKRVYICAENPELIAALDDAVIEYRISSDSFERIVERAYEFASLNKLTLLFSPGYQSFDKFKNFEERGAIFNEIIHKISI